MDRILLHIDMNSYFASVEQQANPFLRGKAMVVSGKEDSRTVIVAASAEAKKMGIKTAMSVFEARKLCSRLIFVQPDPVKYAQITERFFEIFKKYAGEVELFSIDEAFLDLTGLAVDFVQAVEIAKKIKTELKNEVGEWIKCSIGISYNKLLAKLASDLKKPDGLFIIERENKRQVLNQAKPEDICGIGPRLAARLENLGLDTLKKIEEADEKIMRFEFGPHWGPRLKLLASGELDEPVISYYREESVKSASASYTLPQNTFDKDYILKILAQLIEKVCRRLRKNNLVGKTSMFFFRFDNFTHWGESQTWPGYLADDLSFFEWSRGKIFDLNLDRAVRLVGFRVSNLIEGRGQPPLFPKERKRFLLAESLDKINDDFGEHSIHLGSMLGSPRLKKRAGGFKYEI
ncbi:MAG TPA: DNA polymerase IV [Candidatus Bipolaricaulota bacterium]|nr:DNA polymerase IV [Candidatus Bipolaricaulota bacterium]